MMQNMNQSLKLLKTFHNIPSQPGNAAVTLSVPGIIGILCGYVIRSGRHPEGSQWTPGRLHHIIHVRVSSSSFLCSDSCSVLGMVILQYGVTYKNITTPLMYFLVRYVLIQ